MKKFVFAGLIFAATSAFSQIIILPPPGNPAAMRNYMVCQYGSNQYTSIKYRTEYVNGLFANVNYAEFSGIQGLSTRKLGVCQINTAPNWMVENYSTWILNCRDGNTTSVVGYAVRGGFANWTLTTYYGGATPTSPVMPPQTTELGMCQYSTR